MVQRHPRRPDRPQLPSPHLQSVVPDDGKMMHAARTCPTCAIGTLALATKKLVQLVLASGLDLGALTKRFSNITQSSLLGLANFDASNPQESTFRRCLSHILTDAAKPSLEGSSVARSFGIEDG